MTNNYHLFPYCSPKKKDKRTNNATAQRKWIKGQTIKEPKEKVQKDKQYNSPKKKDKRTNNTRNLSNN
jgi:hypothetical protein